ncbi:MAG: nickel pincer cofactor biosynthesis protein LarB [Cyclobacteriaceae bacterium]
MSDKDINIDFGRKDRVGFSEVIFGQSKSVDQVKRIIDLHIQKNAPVLVTKLQADKSSKLLVDFPDAFYDEESGIFSLNANEEGLISGEVAIVSGGTSDAFVVNEAYYTLLHQGQKATRIQDVGVAGLHRLLNRVDEIKTHRIVLAVAGFEAALPTVLAGLISLPIIAVPTSVGYGVAKGGQAALNSLLSSCSNGITVVNIDNGYGAAIAAYRLVNVMENKISIK